MILLASWHGSRPQLNQTSGFVGKGRVVSPHTTREPRWLLRLALHVLVAADLHSSSLLCDVTHCQQPRGWFNEFTIVLHCNKLVYIRGGWQSVAFQTSASSWPQSLQYKLLRLACRNKAPHVWAISVYVIFLLWLLQQSKFTSAIDFACGCLKDIGICL